MSLGRGLVTPASIFQWNDQTLADAFDQVIQLKDGQSPCNVYSVPNVFQVPIFFFPETLRTFNFCSESRLRPLPELPVLGSLITGAEVSRTAKQCTLGTEIVVQPVGTSEVLGSSLNYSNSLTSLTVTSH